MSDEENPEGKEEARKAVLRARARALAQEPSDPETRESVEIVEFRVSHETYGIESAHVSEVYPLKGLTILPCTPSFVLGIISVRGRIFSVIDIRKFFDLPEKGLTDQDKVILLQSEEMEFGIVADAVIGVRKIPDSELQPALPTMTGIRREYLKGIAGEGVVVLDGAKLLSDRSIIVDEKV